MTCRHVPMSPQHSLDRRSMCAIQHNLPLFNCRATSSGSDRLGSLLSFRSNAVASMHFPAPSDSSTCVATAHIAKEQMIGVIALAELDKADGSWVVA